MSKQIKKCAYYNCIFCKTFLHTLVFEDASSPLFLTFCIIHIFRVLRQSFCGKFQIVCGFWNPANPVFRMYEEKGRAHMHNDGTHTHSHRRWVGWKVVQNESAVVGKCNKARDQMGFRAISLLL